MSPVSVEPGTAAIPMIPPPEGQWGSYVRICNFTDAQKWLITVPETASNMFAPHTFTKGNQFELNTGEFAWLTLDANEARCTDLDLPVTITSTDPPAVHMIKYSWDADKKICVPSFVLSEEQGYEPETYQTALTGLMVNDEADNTVSIILSVCTPHEWEERANQDVGASCPYTKADNIKWSAGPDSSA
eukprot:Clim_evm124s134 gene=Clim_evmTU124s134